MRKEKKKIFGDWILTVRPVQMMHINRRKLVSLKSGNFPMVRELHSEPNSLIWSIRLVARTCACHAQNGVSTTPWTANAEFVSSSRQ